MRRLFWKAWLTDRLSVKQPQSVTEQYLRIKIYNARGVEEYTTIDLVSSAGEMRVSDLRARTIKPDGRIIELENKNIFERTVAKAGREKVKMKAFSFAGVVPGDIIEYQWKQYRDNYWSRYNRLYLQREIPTWSVSYFVKPSEFASSIMGYSMNCQTFNAPPASFKETADKF
jgi:hypothetical protein